MLNLNKYQKGQVFLEYGVVLALVITALISIQLYVQRALQAKYKGAADRVISEIRQAKTDASLTSQYEPYYQESDIVSENNAKITQSYSAKGVSITNVQEEKAARSGVRLEHPFSDGAGE